MVYNNTEIEIKFPLKNQREVVLFLISFAKKISENNFQKDTYFTPTDRNFLSVKFPYEWLRLRESKKGNTLNYKHFYPENSKIIDYCMEYETKISKPSKLKKIFESLNFKKLIKVEKNRTTWLYKDVEISIDDVKEIGYFIELETTKSFDDPKKAKSILYKIVKEIGAKVGDEDYKGYPLILLEKKGY